MEANNSKYLSRVFIEDFGNLHNAELCNLKPGLNVIYGKNEAGKTSFTEFIEASIAGFTPKKKDTNNYSKPNIKRSGYLEFCDARTGETFKFQRFDDVNQPVQCDTELDLPPNRDRFEIVNKITSDNLLALDKDNRINQLAAAGASTVISPDKAIENLSNDIDTFKSRKRDNDNSLPILQDEITELQTKIHNQKAELTLAKQAANISQDSSDKEARLNEQLNNINIEINDLQKCVITLENPADSNNLKEDLHALEIELAKLQTQEQFAQKKIEEENEALQKFIKDSESFKQTSKSVNAKSGLFMFGVVATIVFIAASIAMFIANVPIGGIVCLVCAVVGAVIAVAGYKSKHKAQQGNLHNQEESLQKQNKELVEKLNCAQKDKENISKKIAELNSDIAVLRDRINNADKANQDANDEVANLLGEWGLEPDASAREIKQKIDECKAQQQNITKQFKDLGTAKEASKNATKNLQSMQDQLDSLNSELNSLLQKKAELTYKLAVKLVARQMIADANTRWQAEGGYDQNKVASNYLKIMTEGNWDAIEPKTYVVSNTQTGDTLEPFKLSRATTQQTYLAVRMSVLQSPKCTYRDIPVLCDDIFVDFDNERTELALEAVSELSKHRQVIMFTAHKNFAEHAKNKANANIINL